MFNGKIRMFKTPELNAILTDKNCQRLRELTVEDSEKYLWLPTEQVVALPRVVQTTDKDNRSWTRVQVLLIGIHDYLKLTNVHRQLSCFFLPDSEEEPSSFEAIEVETNGSTR